MNTKNREKPNKLMQCNLCKKIWQTYEYNEELKQCPECGSQLKNHTDLAIYKSRLFSSHIITHKAYNELIFGSERGQTWHTEFGKVKGKWIENNQF